MEYLLFIVGVLASIIGLGILYILAKQLWSFGKYLKDKYRFLWYAYTFFWILTSLFIALLISTSGFVKYQEVKIEKAKDDFYQENANILKQVVKDYSELSYILEGSPEDLSTCIPNYNDILSGYNEIDSSSYYNGVNLEVKNRAENIQKTPWNNLTTTEQKRLRIKALNCEKAFGQLTDEVFNRRKAIIETGELSISAVKEKLEDLINSGLDEREALVLLMKDSEFKYHLQEMEQKARDNGSIDPIGSVGNYFDIQASKSAQMRRERGREADKRLEDIKLQSQQRTQKFEETRKQREIKLQEMIKKDEAELQEMIDKMTN